MSDDWCGARVGDHRCVLVLGHVGEHSAELTPPVVEDVREVAVPMSAREHIGRALDGKLTEEQVRILMDEVLSIRKRAWGEFSCKNCGQMQKQPCEIPDAKAVTGALTDLANQAWGRPSEVRQESAELVVNRNVYVIEEAV